MWGASNGRKVCGCVVLSVQTACCGFVQEDSLRFAFKLLLDLHVYCIVNNKCYVSNFDACFFFIIGAAHVLACL
jgi:hypothetical protein